MIHVRRPFLSVPALALAASLTGCGGPEPASPGAPPNAAAPSFVLAADPGPGVGVDEARAKAPSDEVVVVGRVREVTKGLAAFTLVDLGQKYCGQNEMEGCPTPWDYCCIPDEELARHMIGVSARDGAEVALADVGRDLRNLDVVAVRGRLVKEKGEVFLHATGWYRRERPKVAASVEFPR